MLQGAARIVDRWLWPGLWGKTSQEWVGIAIADCGWQASSATRIPTYDGVVGGAARGLGATQTEPKHPSTLKPTGVAASPVL